MIFVPVIFAIYRGLNHKNKAENLVERPEELARGPYAAEASVDLWLDRVAPKESLAAVC